MSSDPTRHLAASVAANERWAHEPDRTAATAAARVAFMARFEHQVDPDGTLPPEERARRAANARKAHFQRLALKSQKARAKRRTAAADRELAAELRAAADLLGSAGDRQ